ncbi:hypothetical protein H9Q74_011533 [Fusarium xylarioides]|nr:hypothetical protein H9Q71_011955 [Fusarium xylarioides]KAG5815731.1 hypothetical protein H9Q74_011533 [Fusarium xylarioides]
MPSKLQVYEGSIQELRRRRIKTEDHLRDAKQRYEYHYNRWLKGASSSECDRYAKKIQDLEYALTSKLPEAYSVAYRKWLIEYWASNGLIALPLEITHMIEEGLSTRYTRQIEREVERQLFSREDNRARAY